MTQTEFALLSQGIETLCKNDSDIDSLITPRSEEINQTLDRYIKEIELFNKAYGLVGTDSAEELVIKHILDSIAPLGIISRLLKMLNTTNDTGTTFQIADAGSGAGLPGIPLAITLPQCNFSLIERMGRRAGFLCGTKAVLSLTNITVEESELEKIAHNKFDLVTFRAFKPIEKKLLKTLFNICKEGGIIAAYKGKTEKIKEEMSFLERTKWEVIPYSVPFLNEERHMLIIKN
ncbi:MAG: 16S rRNA (guanine(527)-N(7))-methyltransferase RsmG [Treponema sp.]|nr:16S rRNA (guanine(527)-N(7))-methyltransferase RsmG [Treponema sp.]MCL2252316.1 16S rRNA (guanine(527)-N(7))-methyltransferase RsmG [Treponema sp.]